MRVNGSTVRAADKLAMDQEKLLRTLRRRYGFTRRDLVPLNAGQGETYTAGGVR